MEKGIGVCQRNELGLHFRTGFPSIRDGLLSYQTSGKLARILTNLSTWKDFFGKAELLDGML